MALVDADYKFIFVDVGAQGRIGDAGVYNNCKLSKLLDNNKLNIPLSEMIQGITQPIPYTVVADDAFPLKTYIMKPFQQRNLSKREVIFNYRLSRARRVVENAFGILVNRFRVFRAPILLSPAKAKLVVLATVALHNMLRVKNTTDSQTTSEEVNFGDATEISTETHSSSEPIGALHSIGRCRGRYTTDAKEMRECLADYFSTTGQVSWQDFATGYQQTK
jgi:hypothetical protein